MFNITSTNLGTWLLDAGLFDPGLDESGDGWSIWTATSLSEGAEIKRKYLYITPSCPWSELDRAKDFLDGSKQERSYRIIFPNSAAPQLDQRYIQRLKSLFPSGTPLTLQTLYYSAIF